MLKYVSDSNGHSPYPTIFGKEIGSAMGLFYLAFGVFAVALILCIIIVNSQFGLTMNAVRDDEERAEFFGYKRCRKYKDSNLNN